MNIENVSISAIKPYSKNAKKHPKEQVEKIMRSIERFGWAQPLVVDKENVLIIGHGRLEAAKKLKMDTVPVLRMENLSDEEVNALRLADNKLNESEWDMELVNLELGEMSDELKELTGFEMPSIEDYGTSFDLADGDKQPFQQITFSLANAQAEVVKDAISKIKESEQYKYIETFGNENTNGNALYALIMERYG